MRGVGNIYYTDAYYGGGSTIPPETRPPHCEAYGFIFNDADSFFIHFIKRVGEEIAPSDFQRGLIIPKEALLSQASSTLSKGKKFVAGDDVSITWKDVVHVAHTKRDGASRMQTSGEVFKDEDDHVVIRNPKTVRTHPLPRRNHPESQPLYYVIPKSLIEGVVAGPGVASRKGGRVDDGNELVRVRFIYGDNNEYECVGVRMWERDGNTRIAFNALNDEVEDFIDIPTKWIQAMGEVKNSDVTVFR